MEITFILTYQLMFSRKTFCHDYKKYANTKLKKVRLIVKSEKKTRYRDWFKEC